MTQDACPCCDAGADVEVLVPVYLFPLNRQAYVVVARLTGVRGPSREFLDATKDLRRATDKVEGRTAV